MFPTRRLLFGAALKKTTGLVGLPVVPNAREQLTDLYMETLQAVKLLPEGSPYRKSVEQITNYRLSVVKNNQDVEQIENDINCGQVEELILQAKEELDLIPFMKDNLI